MKMIFDELSIEMSTLTTKKYSTSFSLGIKTLNKDLQKPIYAIYGFVRFADEIVDSFQAYDSLVLLEDFKAQTYRAIEQKISLNPILNSFQWVVNKYQIPCEPELIPVNEVIIIECEASPGLIEQLRSRKQSYTVYLRHNKYDDECIPAARRNREIRLYVYNENDLTELGPINPPAVIRTGRLNGVTFTKNSPRNGTSASWEDRPGYEHMTIHHKKPSDSTTALVATAGKSPDDEAWTISAFVIDDNPVNELFLADKLKPCLVGDESKREVRFDGKVFEKSNEVDLIKGNSSQETERNYVTIIRNQRPGYNSKYYGTVDNIHYQNLTKWAAKKCIQLFRTQSKEPYLFIRLGYILDTSK